MTAGASNPIGPLGGSDGVDVGLLESLQWFALVESLGRRPPFLYWAFRRLLLAAETWDRTERAAWQATRLSRTLRLAQKLPGYVERNGGASLSSWPTLTKAEVAGAEQFFNASRFLPSYRTATGGTTGRPLKIQRSLTIIALEHAVIDHLCAKIDVDMRRSRVAVLRGDFVKSPSDMSPPYWRAAGPRRRVFSSLHLTSSTLPHYLKELREFAPNVLMCYPSSLQHLLALLQDAGEVLRIHTVFAASEMLPPSVAALARRALDAHVIDHYGQAERLTVAYAIDGADYVFIPVYGVARLVPESGHRARLLGTSLWNDRQILVQYDTEDIIRIPSCDPETLNGIALGTVSFGGIEGRASEQISLPDGRSIIGLNHIPRGVAGASSVQLRYDGQSTVYAYVVPQQDYTPQTEATIRQNFYKKFPSEIEIRICRVDSPIRTQAGKTPLLLPAEKS